MSTSVYQTLVAGRKLIEKPETWTRGTYALNRNRLACSPEDTEAVCFCSIGALRRARMTVRKAGDDLAPSVLPGALDCLERHAFAITGRRFIAQFNDQSTHSQVLAVWDAAIAEAKERGM